MFSKFELMIGIRYLRSKHKQGFVSFISLISMTGIALGVATLITVLSVMNGFQKEIKNKIIGITSHMQITDISGKLADYADIGSTALANRHVLSYAPYVDGQALVTFDTEVSGALIRGIDSQLEQNTDNFASYMIDGDFNTLVPGSFNALIGADLARSLGVTLYDKIIVITPDGHITPAGMLPRIKQFTVSGIFNTHMYDYDNSLLLINLNDAQLLFKYGTKVSGVRLKVDDVLNTQSIKQELLPKSSNLLISTWIDQHKTYFAAVDLEKRMMSLVLVLIIAVAAFNLVSTLIMTVQQKRSDIAILRTMGVHKSSIIKIFVIQGGISGLLGTSVGVGLGLLLSKYIGQVVNLLERITHHKIINGDVYLIDYLPSDIVASDVLIVACISIILSLIATIYPSRQAASLDPVTVLRYE